MFIIDAHQDLAYNALNFQRDYTRSAAETRKHERAAGSQTPLHNGNTLLGWQDFQDGRVAVIFSTLFAAPARRSIGTWDRVTYRDAEEARRHYLAQLDVYHRMVDSHPDKYMLIETRQDLTECLAAWNGEPGPDNGRPVGLVILMEGAEGVREVAELEEWWARGVRIVGPAWAGTRFCGGTGEPGPMTREGFALLEGLHAFGMALDISHMDEQAALQAIDSFPGRLIASHANAAALMKGSETNRHISDHVIAGLLERGGMVGVVPFNRFLKVGWKISDGRQAVSLADVFAHIDHVCQIAGDALHVGIGSDFDGGFGIESVPVEIDTIADLNKLIPILKSAGYLDQDIAAIMGENWQRFLEQALPETV